MLKIFRRLLAGRHLESEPVGIISMAVDHDAAAPVLFDFAGDATDRSPVAGGPPPSQDAVVVDLQ